VRFSFESVPPAGLTDPGNHAPAAVVVELRASSEADGLPVHHHPEAVHNLTRSRCYRLSVALGPRGLLLDKPAPFTPGSPVRASFKIPGQPTPLCLNARIEVAGDPDEEEGNFGGKILAFHAAQPAEVAQLSAYVAARLGA